MPFATSFLRDRWAAFSRTPFGCLLRLFLGRMFHGGGETGAEEFGLGIGALLILLAMPGLLVSLLLFEKYGSLIRFIRGDGAYDPFTATIPDEYFFIVLSTTVTGAVALWRWDSIFLDRRDHANLVPLPVSLRTLFFANLSAILALAALFAIVVNAASLILFPVVVVGSQSSFPIFVRFAAGHAIAVLFASIFSFFAIFALAGLLMAVLPPSAFRRVSLLARFVMAIFLLGLLASVFAVPDLLRQMSVANAHTMAKLPPISSIGVARSVWVKGNDAFAAGVARAALFAFGLTALTAVVAYSLSFRRSFLRIPEMADVSPLPRMRPSFSPLAIVHKVMLRAPSQRACYHFITRTLLRSDPHLQIVSAFAALGLVAAVETVTSIHADKFFFIHHVPSADFLSTPLVLSYCIVVGIRFAFEIPANLDSNWIFKLWLHGDDRQARSVARRILLIFSMSWLAPACFAVTFFYFGWLNALLHTTLLIVGTALLVEALLIHFRKIPFTSCYPAFQSNSGVILVAYLFGFFVFTDYFPEIEHWALASPVLTVSFVPLFAAAFAALRAYRNQILDMDKQLIFEESSPSAF
jgi:hypothetical protein